MDRPAAAPARKPGLDVIRAAAILVVMLHHFRRMPGSSDLFQWFALRGYIGVDLFFVLSGWLIGGQLMRETRTTGTIALGRFWMKRWFRTLPAYFATLAVLVAGRQLALGRVPRFLVFSQNYTAPLDWLVTWSLCIEEHFYLLLPLIVLALLRLPRPARLTAVGGFILLSPFLRWVAFPSMAAGSFHRFLADFYGPTHLRLEGLALGVTMAAVAQYRTAWWDVLQRFARPLAIGGALVVVASTWAPWLTGWSGNRLERMAFFPAVPGFLLVSVGTAMLLPLASRDVPGFGRSWAPFVWVSEHAYTLYLTHEHSMSVARKLLTDASPFWLRLVASFALSFVVAAALRKLVEEPGLRLRDRLLAARRGPSDALSGSPG